jgi:hypothetical protein
MLKFKNAVANGTITAPVKSPLPDCFERFPHNATAEEKRKKTLRWKWLRSWDGRFSAQGSRDKYLPRLLRFCHSTSLWIPRISEL